MTNSGQAARPSATTAPRQRARKATTTPTPAAIHQLVKTKDTKTYLVLGQADGNKDVVIPFYVGKEAIASATDPATGIATLVFTFDTRAA